MYFHKMCPVRGMAQGPDAVNYDPLEMPLRPDGTCILTEQYRCPWYKKYRGNKWRWGCHYYDQATYKCKNEERIKDNGNMRSRGKSAPVRRLPGARRATHSPGGVVDGAR